MLRAKIEELNTVRDQLQGAQAETVRQKILALQQQIEALPPPATDQDQAYVDLLAHIQQAIDDAREQLPRPRDITDREVRERAVPSLEGVTLLSPAPVVYGSGRRAERERTRLARYRLQIFLWAGYLITIAFLAGAGFSQLYLAKPGFGADPWTDYSALLAWGFGAEAARAAIVGVIGARSASESPGSRPNAEGAS
jgi:hypothetical protein